MMFTLLGVIALLLRERRVNNDHSDQDDEVDQNDVPPVRNSDVREINDYDEDPSLVEPSDGQSEEPSQQEPVDGENELPQEEPVDDQNEEPSQDEPAEDQREPSQEEPVDGEIEPQEEPADDQGEDGSLIIRINSCSYKITAELGEGGFGNVYAATRLADGLPVAIKCCPILDNETIRIDGFDNPLPVEIALHSLAVKGPKVKEIIELLDWQVDPKHYIMVLEHPIPCQSLFDFLIEYKTNIKEDKLRKIMHQATIAAQTCCQRKVFHRDIKLENLLINPDTFEVKLIDFGCGALLKDTAYSSYCGTTEFCPPEFRIFGKYYWEPTTVWSLGITLYLLIFRKFPEKSDLLKIREENVTIQNLSKECCNFIQCCLEINYRKRINLEKLSRHNWFKMEDKKKLGGTSSCNG